LLLYSSFGLGFGGDEKNPKGREIQFLSAFRIRIRKTSFYTFLFAVSLSLSVLNCFLMLYIDTLTSYTLSLSALTQSQSIKGEGVEDQENNSFSRTSGRKFELRNEESEIGGKQRRTINGIEGREQD
jgi:hypothetical protein